MDAGHQRDDEFDQHTMGGVMEVMARYTGPVCKLCRREGQKLFLKGQRCYTDKCAIDRRSYAPGQHGKSSRKESEYGLQLREKQKLKRIYGVLERQFARYFDLAERRKGLPGENLLKILETRLDNIVYRMGFARSRTEARQLVRHGFFSVNGKKVNIPSLEVRPGDTIEIRDKQRNSSRVRFIREELEDIQAPEWLEVDLEAGKGRLLAVPARDEIDVPIEEHLIVELYSR
jgi:small subunit ribosomal protein S4